MSFREQVPNEVWLEIFRLLSRETLKALSLTSNDFKDISRAFLFAHLKFHPYAIPNPQRNTVLLPSNAKITACFDRLDFWFSDGIARHVRSCDITPWQPTHQAASLFSEPTTRSPYILLDSFFQRLGLFTGLQRLHADGVHFTQSRVASLCHAPALTEVRLVRCSIADGEHIDPTSLQLGVSMFSFSNGVTVEDGIGLWIPLLRPQHLRELYLTCHPRFFGEDLAAIPRFPHVHTLTITANYSTMSYNLAILSKFPAVQIFALSGWGEVLSGPGVPLNALAVLPLLQRYTCPCRMMALFIPRSTLIHLAIAYCSPEDFTEQLQAINNNITSLDLTFNNCDMTVLQTVCDFFPMLTALHIRIDCDVERDDEMEDGAQYINDRATAFFSELGNIVAIPARLQRLAIIWTFEYIDEDDSVGPDLHEVEIPKMNELRDVLVESCPGLTTLWLDGGDFLFHWRTSLDGAAEDYFTVNEDEAIARRKTLSDFWAAR